MNWKLKANRSSRVADAGPSEGTVRPSSYELCPKRIGHKAPEVTENFRESHYYSIETLRALCLCGVHREPHGRNIADGEDGTYFGVGETRRGAKRTDR